MDTDVLDHFRTKLRHKKTIVYLQSCLKHNSLVGMSTRNTKSLSSPMLAITSKRELFSYEYDEYTVLWIRRFLARSMFRAATAKVFYLRELGTCFEIFN